MTSTTHIDLRLRALEMGIETKVIHGTSIQSAVSGLTGIQNYRYGRSTTIPFDYKGKPFTSPYLVVRENLRQGLHSLIFLDLSSDRKCMTIGEGVELLIKAEEEEGYELLKGVFGVGIARAGSSKPVVKTDLLSKLMDHDFGDPLHILLVLAKLHFMEAQSLVRLAEGPEAILGYTF